MSQGVAAQQSGARDFVEYPLDVTSIDGYARKAYADSVGISTLACVEFDIGQEEALRMILSKHGRCLGWNDYNRIRMAFHLNDDLRKRAHANQQAGGRLKGSSHLTEANVRKEIAAAAYVSEGQVTKFNQIQGCDPEVLKALAGGEIRIHRAWMWRHLSQAQQREELRQDRLERGLKQPAKSLAFRHSHARSRRVVLTVAKARELLERVLKVTLSERENSELIEIGVINASDKKALVTTQLLRSLLGEIGGN